MAKKSLNMMEKMINPNIIDYYIINCAIPSIITVENRKHNGHEALNSAMAAKHSFFAIACSIS